MPKTIDRSKVISELDALMDDDEFFAMFTNAMFRDFRLFLQLYFPADTERDFGALTREFLRSRVRILRCPSAITSQSVFLLLTIPRIPVQLDDAGKPQFIQPESAVFYPHLEIQSTVPCGLRIAAREVTTIANMHSHMHVMALCVGRSHVFSPSAIYRMRDSRFAVTPLIQGSTKNLELIVDGMEPDQVHSLFVMSSSTAKYDVSLESDSGAELVVKVVKAVPP